jgi:serpin B
MTDEARLLIEDVIHEAFISIDEHGTEAAAATAVVIRVESAPQPAELSVDRPFLFFIQDQATGTVLFMGRVTDPTAG